MKLISLVWSTVEYGNTVAVQRGQQLPLGVRRGRRHVDATAAGPQRVPLPHGTRGRRPGARRRAAAARL